MTLCDVCRAKRIRVASGWVCPNGHGRIVPDRPSYRGDAHEYKSGAEIGEGIARALTATRKEARKRTQQKESNEKDKP